MDVVKARIFRYSLPIKHPTVKTREGLLLQLQKGPKTSSWSEIAPYPELNSETLGQALEQLLLCPTCTGINFDALYPSVSFGLQSALQSIYDNETPQQTLPLSALLLGSPAEILEKAKQMYSLGFHSAKLKIAQLTLDEAKNVIRALQDRFFLRIDANRMWPLQKILKLIASFDPAIFDYFEEPVDKLGDLAKFPLPFAIDESLADFPILPNLRALIIKPTVFGGFSRCKAMLDFARKNHLQCILSSTFESGIGLMQIARLAGQLGLCTHPLGLGTFSYLLNDLLEEPLPIQKGVITLKNVRPKMVLLDEIAAI